MANLFIPQEEDFRRWIRESVKEEVQETLHKQSSTVKLENEPLLSRNDIAAQLGISLVTLTDWMKKGMPFLRMNGRVYFRWTEVIESMSHNKLNSANKKSYRHGK